MKRLIIALLLFFAAIAISPILIGEKGYILIAMGQTTIESTVVTASIALVLSFIGLLILLKIVRGGVIFSFNAWHKVRFAGQRRAFRNLQKGIAAYVLGDNKQAEHLLVKSAEPTQFTQTAYLMAASAADKQGLPDNTKHYLQQLTNDQLNIKETGLESVLITIQLLLNHKEYAKARTLIDQHHKFIGHDDRLLALEIELSLTEQRYYYVVEQLVAARKSNILTQMQISGWEENAFLGGFRQKIKQEDNAALNNYWNSLARKVKQRDTVVIAYCHVLAENRINDPLAKILLPILKKGSNETLIKAIRHLPLSNVGELIKAVQKHLHHDQHSGKWMSALAHLSMMDNQWQMAEKAFNTLMHLDGQQYDKVDIIAFANVLEKQQKPEEAIRALHKALSI